MKTKSKFLGAIVLGMQDAIVSQTGIIAGLGATLSDRHLTLLTMIVAAAADALSMMAANFQASRADGKPNPWANGAYTGISYIATAAVLIIPFAIFTNRIWAIAATGIIAVATIFIFNFSRPHKNRAARFFEMITICAATSAAAFTIGVAAKYFLGITI